MNATLLQFPKSPVDGTVAMFLTDAERPTEYGRLMHTWTEEEWSQLEESTAKFVQAKIEFAKVDSAALESLRAALALRPAYPRTK